VNQLDNKGSITATITASPPQLQTRLTLINYTPSDQVFGWKNRKGKAYQKTLKPGEAQSVPIDEGVLCTRETLDSPEPTFLDVTAQGDIITFSAGLLAVIPPTAEST